MHATTEIDVMSDCPSIFQISQSVCMNTCYCCFLLRALLEKGGVLLSKNCDGTNRFSQSEEELLPSHETNLVDKQKTSHLF